ncbi:hypothetical protein [Ligilactobacillus salivarius]|uniref:hypothetical protein n=1 Tax=Ligilactobacillus salivarius TaxID=1624 RepID=UPI0013694058|nr:hypothetical protein [Ligilactobacillus salivarius]MYU70725.1 hypothetical protein [Ligilactobacillus salivarius]MYU72749.1 hypothetical protein [Ligilactobacillus salivarius]MYU82994.1 hypothetical protein [Ligilactobacillus salivarius]MYU86676.1 hypothetical protein [Ligilactobacillus salivarius]MYU88571.1 hypothetical protein [Ligilactobacillus salivarius]
MKKLENRPYQKQQPPQMPIVAVYFTDKQFEEIKQGVIDGTIDKLIREIARDEIKKYDLKAPYLNQKEFSEWIGESVATIKQLKAKGLPVSKALNTDRYGKQSYIDFMRQHER